MLVIGRRHRKKLVSGCGLSLLLLMDHLGLFPLLSLLGFFCFLCTLSGQFLFILFIMSQQLLLSRISKKKGTALCLVDNYLILCTYRVSSSMRGQNSVVFLFVEILFSSQLDEKNDSYCIFSKIYMIYCFTLLSYQLTFLDGTD